MGEKKTLVVYYSRTGTTKKLAEAVAEALQADVEEIIDKKSRSGAWGFIVAGKDAATKTLTDIAETAKAPSAYDIVVIGTPVWASTMACAIRTYLTQKKDGLQEVAFFLTTGGGGIERTFAQMEELCGKAPVGKLGLTMKEVRKGDYLERVKEFVQAVSA